MVLPPVSVSPPRVKSPVVAVMLKIRESSLASIVTFAASGRASITSASPIASSVPPSVIVAPESAAANVIVFGAGAAVGQTDRLPQRQIARRVVAVVFIGCGVHDEIQAGQGLPFVGADVDPRSAGAVAVEDPHEGGAPLVELGRVEHDARIARVNRRAAGQQGVGLRRAAVIDQRAQERIEPRDVADAYEPPCRGHADQAVVDGERALEIFDEVGPAAARRVAGHNRTADRERMVGTVLT